MSRTSPDDRPAGHGRKKRCDRKGVEPLSIYLGAGLFDLFLFSIGPADRQYLPIAAAENALPRNDNTPSLFQLPPIRVASPRSLIFLR